MAHDELIYTFLEEAQENLQALEDGLLALEKNNTDASLIDKIFRAMHTIKGGAGLVGLMQIATVAHHLENLLEDVRQGKETITPQVSNILFSGTDLINKMIASESIGEEGFDDEISTLKLMVDFDKGPVPTIEEVVGAKRYYKIQLKFRKDIFETGTDPLMLILELEEYGDILATHVNTEGLSDIYNLDAQNLYITWTIFLTSDKGSHIFDEIFIFVKDDNTIMINDITDDIDRWFNDKDLIRNLFLEQAIVSPNDVEQAVMEQMGVGESILETKDEKISQDNNQAAKKESGTLEINDTIRVDSKKLEGILNLIAELLISQSRVKEIVFQIPQMNKPMEVEVTNAFGEVDKIIRLLQEEVMHTSMIPIGGTFIRYQRMVRDLAQELNKDVDLIISGKDTELDKKVIEQITDPLKHLVRNCVDHGLETPEERIKAGKPPQGIVSLNAFHQEGSFVIEISDDGKGIDSDKVMAKAMEKGLIDKSANLTESEIQKLLFMPGFSTASQITDVSGRGVGLDVVMTNIKNLRGSVEVTSEKGKGTKFTLRLPLTLAIIDGMIIRVGEERFILPLTAISEFVKIQAKDILRAEGKGLIVHLRNEYVPYMGLYELLKLEADCKNPTEGILVILKDQQKKLALLVDEIIGQDQVVIKNIKDSLEETDGMAGATILGDGKVAVILDVSSLFRLVKKQNKIEQGKVS